MIPTAVTTRLSAAVAGKGDRHEVIAPFTGRPLVTHRTSTESDVRDAFTAARRAQADWARTDVAVRAEIFVRFHDRIIDNSQLIDIVQAESGKSRYSAFEETLDIAGLSLYYGRNAADFLRPRRRKGAIPLATRPQEFRRPKGVAAIISPFNYPLSLGVCDVIPALLAGNAVVHKPDTQTVMAALFARELLVECGLPAQLWQIVIGEPSEIGDALVDSADHVCFTGSTAAGRRIAEAAGRRLIGCTLELGGKNPMIVLADADLKKAAKGAARACFSTAGQLCLSIERLYVADEVFDEFMTRLVDATRALELGTGLSYDYSIGSLTSKRQFDAVARHVDDAVGKGATVVAGGRARPDIGPYFFEPTILTGVTPEMNVFADETFGPVVSVYPFADEAEAVRCANDTPYGLNASVWSRDVHRARALGEQIQAGTVNVNEGYGSAYASNDAPMGGMKASGQGRRHGEHGLLEYCELQTVASQHVIGFDPLPGLSLARNSWFLTRLYKMMKGLRIT